MILTHKSFTTKFHAKAKCGSTLKCTFTITIIIVAFIRSHSFLKFFLLLSHRKRSYKCCKLFSTCIFFIFSFLINFLLIIIFSLLFLIKLLAILILLIILLYRSFRMKYNRRNLFISFSLLTSTVFIFINICLKFIVYYILSLAFRFIILILVL